jgi:SpoVK/Ycf46/Vps4 family AAA+-type ATPase
MEIFRGVFICTTNLVELLDPAVMRRFSWKIKFLPLKKDHRIKIVQRYFALPSLSDVERSAFQEITGLTPGDVKAVWRKHGSSPPLSPIELAEELTRETDFRTDKERRIGFAPY